MKVDQYRILKAKEYSFLVPAGKDLGDYEQPEQGYLEAYQPFALENQDVELETVVTGLELGKATDDLEKNSLAVILSVPIPSAAETSEAGID